MICGGGRGGQGDFYIRCKHSSVESGYFRVGRCDVAEGGAEGAA